MLTDAQKTEWDEKGYFILKGFADETVVEDIDGQIAAALRKDSPADHPDTPFYAVGPLLVALESQEDMQVTKPEDAVSKIFNTHLEGPCEAFACDQRLGAIVSALLDGNDVDVFQSQFIYKNPSAWGQPWHQDSYYFRFDQQPQIGVWLAISEATLDNGCLAVLPGSHKGPIHAHHPDSRPNANYGYLEIRDQNVDAAEPVLMQPGDVLIFHSFLMHRSYDNKSNGPRKAMVFHHGRAGTKVLAEAAAGSEAVTHFRPAYRKSVG